MVNRRGYFLLEVAAGVAIATMVAVSTFAVLRAHALNARMAYEEAVAREVAGARLERLEAGGWAGLREGSAAVPVDAPGWENLPEARCELSVGPEVAGVRSVAVEVSWEAAPGARRSVRLRTVSGRVP